MKKIVTSLAMILFVGAVVASGTGAFFSDTETSTGNVFTAGAIDLTVDSEQHYNGKECIPNTAQGEVAPFVWGPGASAYPVTGTACDGTWLATDLGAQKFWNFTDVKPGDEGENTVSLHVDNNDAYACVDLNITKNDDMTCVDPEKEAEGLGICGTDGTPLFDGELAQDLTFFAWADNGAGQGGVKGDNIWQAGEPKLFSNTSGPASDVLGGKTYTLADSSTGPLVGGVTSYIGLAWCAGTIDASVLGVITCNGATMGNEAQTDSMEASIAFRVEQARNNQNFVCRNVPGTNPNLVVVNPNALNGWEAYADQYVGPGTTGFVADGSATIGGGVLRLQTVGNDSRVGLFNDNFNLALAGVQIAYDSKQLSGVNPAVANATIRLWIDTNGDNTADDQLMYEPYYNIQTYNPLNAISILSNTWQTWRLDGTNGQLWSNWGVTYNSKPAVPAGGYGVNITIADVLASYPTAKIVGISFSMGTYNPDQVILVDNFVMNGVTYNFEN